MLKFQGLRVCQNFRNFVCQNFRNPQATVGVRLNCRVEENCALLTE